MATIQQKRASELAKINAAALKAGELAVLLSEDERANYLSVLTVRLVLLSLYVLVMLIPLQVLMPLPSLLTLITYLLLAK